MVGDPQDAILEAIFDEVEELRMRMPDADRARHLEQRADARAPGTAGRAARFPHVGETLELNGRLDQALRWFQPGLTRDQGDDYGWLNGRYRVRRALGLLHDRYDAVCEERRWLS